MTFDDIERYFVSKLPNNRCPCCGSTRWNINWPEIIDNGQYVSSIIPLGMARADSEFSNGDVSMMGGAPVVTLECDECGFAEMFTLSKIHKWLESNKAPANKP